MSTLAGRSDGGAPSAVARGSALIEHLHLAVLSAISLAHPVLEVLGAAPGHFAARRASGWDAAALLLACMVVPPAAMSAALSASGRLGLRHRRRLYLALLGFLVATLCAPPLRRAGVGSPLLVSTAAGLAFTWAYTRAAALRDLVSFLAPALIAVPLVFYSSLVGEDLFHSHAMLSSVPERRGEPASVVRRPLPVVFLVFDELPLGLLLDASGQINSERFPGFAELARESTWYRDATSGSSATLISIPSMLTGQRIPFIRAASFENYPGSLFHLLSRSHRLRITEYWTTLRPPSDLAIRQPAKPPPSPALMLAQDAARLATRIWLVARPGPAAARGWQEPIMPLAWKEAYLDGERLFREFLTGLEGGEEPVLHYCHLMVPHSPYQRLPTGQRYSDDLTNLAERTEPPGEDEASRLLQRAALQAGWADRMVTRLLARLREVGLLDRAVIVVASDHGISFQAGARFRTTTPANLDELAPVPLFIRVPGEPVGVASDAPVELLDVFPTVARAVGAEVPWSVEGQVASLVRSDVPRRRANTNGNEAPIEFSDRWLGRRAAGRFAARIGAEGWEQVWRLGPHRALVFRSVADLQPAGWSEVQVRWQSERGLSAVDPRADTIPGLVSLRLEPPVAANVLVVLNGKVAASVAFAAAPAPPTSVLLPPSLLVPGNNELDFLVESPGVPTTFLRTRSARVTAPGPAAPPTPVRSP